MDSVSSINISPAGESEISDRSGKRFLMELIEGLLLENTELRKQIQIMAESNIALVNGMTDLQRKLDLDLAQIPATALLPPL